MEPWIVGRSKMIFELQENWWESLDLMNNVTAFGRHRKIIHFDMDCFYAAVEMRERPELRTRPIAIGSSPFSRCSLYRQLFSENL